MVAYTETGGCILQGIKESNWIARRTQSEDYITGKHEGRPLVILGYGMG